MDPINNLNTGSIAIDLQSIHEISEYRFQETIQALLKRLEYEVMISEENSRFTPEILFYGMLALQKIGTKKEFSQVELKKKLMSPKSPRLKSQK